MTDQIQIKCAKCGSYDFEYPANPKLDDIITCTGCGAKARYEDVISEAEKQVHNLAEDIMSKAFSKFR